MLTFGIRDYELRFTVHESPDYFRLKVSVFNDDKKTDLIGETWVDLRELIIPGGGQRDNWHPLQCRGRYAGEVRIEMTYYDTRPEDETVVEKRSMAAERIQAKATGGPTGNRQVKDIKRRPLPGDPNVPAHVRPGPPEKNFSAPQLPSTRNFHHEPQGWSDNSRQGLRQPTTAPAVMPPEAPYETSTSGPPGPRQMRGYDNNPDERSRPSTAPKSQPVIHQPTPVHPPVSLPHIPSTKRFYNEKPYAPREPASDPYETQPRNQYARPHSSYETAPTGEYHPSWQDFFPNRSDIQPASEQPYETRPGQNSTRGYDLAAEQQQLYGDEPTSYGPSAARYSQRSLRGLPAEPIQPEYAEPEPEYHYQHRNSIANTHRNTLRHSISHEVPGMGYASMQPSVEDEEEEGPPPPPPVHRSGLSQQSSQHMMPSPTPSYKAYSNEYASSPRASEDVNFSSQPSHYVPDNVRLQDLPPHNNASSMPPSLVPGFDPMIADEETERLYQERRESRRRSTLFDEDAALAPQPLVPQPAPPSSAPYPVDPPSQPATDDRGSMSGALVRSRGGSYASTDSRIAPQRKSVSPQPPPVEDRSAPAPAPVPTPAPVATQIPFSPDSFDAFNPNASRSVLGSDPAEAEAARKSEQEASKEPGPIIGDDGREIDPSDHLPSDTWAPEPEKKTKKPELVVRFKSPPAQATSPRPSVSRESRPIRVTFKPQTQAPEKIWERPTSSSNSRQRSPGPGAMERTSPRMEMTRGRDMYSYGRGQSYSRSPGVDSSESSRRTSVSPSPGSSTTSSLYAPVSTGPPIPAKVPIAQPMNQSYPMISSNHYSYGVPERGGIEALSRELNTIDIGSVGSNTNRAMRKYVPRVTMGYAS